ncbi:MAG: hypothetical protein K9L62_00535 [Vallitaleaceae bacterium]|nr:hypothetical protein [Vallitaleaceae bacterium]
MKNETVQAIIQFVWDWRFVILLAITTIFKAITDWQGFKTKLTGLMLQAKDKAKDGILKSGQEQEEWVVRMALQMLPETWKKFMSEEKLRFLIKKLYNSAMDMLDNGKIDKSWPPVV